MRVSNNAADDVDAIDNNALAGRVYCELSNVYQW